MTTIKEQVYRLLTKNPGLSSVQIAERGNFGQRTYVAKVLSMLVKENRVRFEKHGRQIIYFVSDTVIGLEEDLRLKGLHEDEIWAKLRKTSTFLVDLSEQAENILYFAFTEMLNNAIDHSKSGGAYVKIWLESGKLKFVVRNYGIGVFRNAMVCKHLPSELTPLGNLSRGNSPRQLAATLAKGYSGPPKSPIASL